MPVIASSTVDEELVPKKKTVFNAVMCFKSDDGLHGTSLFRIMEMHDM